MRYYCREYFGFRGYFGSREYFGSRGYFGSGEYFGSRGYFGGNFGNFHILLYAYISYIEYKRRCITDQEIRSKIVLIRV